MFKAACDSHPADVAGLSGPLRIVVLSTGIARHGPRMVRVGAILYLYFESVLTAVTCVQCVGRARTRKNWGFAQAQNFSRAFRWYLSPYHIEVLYHSGARPYHVPMLIKSDHHNLCRPMKSWI